MLFFSSLNDKKQRASHISNYTRMNVLKFYDEIQCFAGAQYNHTFRQNLWAHVASCTTSESRSINFLSFFVLPGSTFIGIHIQYNAKTEMSLGSMICIFLERLRN